MGQTKRLNSPVFYNSDDGDGVFLGNFIVNLHTAPRGTKTVKTGD